MSVAVHIEHTYHVIVNINNICNNVIMIIIYVIIVMTFVCFVFSCVPVEDTRTFVFGFFFGGGGGFAVRIPRRGGSAAGPCWDFHVPRCPGCPLL